MSKYNVRLNKVLTKNSSNRKSRYITPQNPFCESYEHAVAYFINSSVLDQNTVQLNIL